MYTGRCLKLDLTMTAKIPRQRNVVGISLRLCESRGVDETFEWRAGLRVIVNYRKR